MTDTVGLLMARTLAALLASLLTVSAARAEDRSKCTDAPPVLWGDGEHDDTAALNAWFRGETVIWAETHQAVGPQIADRTFLLSSTVYVHSGIDRKLERFQMVWPHRSEVVSGGTIEAGKNPDDPPVADNITKVNSDPDEGVPYDGPPPEPTENGVPRHCLTS